MDIICETPGNTAPFEALGENLVFMIKIENMELLLLQ